MVELWYWAFAMQNQPPKNLACHCQGPLEDMQQDSQDAWIAFIFTVQRGKTYCAISAIDSTPSFWYLSQ